MASDIFIKFNKWPSVEDVGKALRGYIGTAATVEYDEQGGRYYVTFPEKSSGPLKELNPEFYYEREDECRWIEVICGIPDQFDVLTRQQDEFTNNVAMGFAKFCARYWKGHIEDF